MPIYLQPTLRADGTYVLEGTDPIGRVNLGFTDYLGAAGSALGNLFNGGKDSLGYQLGTLGLGLYGLFQNNNSLQDQLDEARRQFDFSKNVSRANFTTSGTNFLNQGLFQLEGLKAFNPTAAAERASNFTAAANQLNNAGSLIGMNNAFGEQINAIDKYNQLVGA